MTITTAGARFLAAFNDIENHFRSTLRADVAVGFAQLIRDYGQRRTLSQQQRNALVAFASLRNAISHGTYYGGRPIADPVETVVQEIEHLRQQIVEPPLALTVLKSGKVCAVRPDDPISIALEHVRAFGYSQLPVYDDGYVGVLTTNAIARWLADQMTRNTGMAEEEPVRQVLRFAEPGEGAVLVPRAITVVEAIDLLSQSCLAGQQSMALIITQNGRRTDKPLRLVVPFDLPILTQALAFN
ncbi:CBS domain-containing protein [Micromonospora sp. C97]|uniref:CBS domain-containing protein n=1 Tax=Micromonospora sp. C97 TaxID=2824883 RepID=UPI001B35F910|nr:CBS domain-containing protein [Micromonospora sp. C97]MBQ1028487.1 CBS domain-containing protein [Micromonospora sp. C97]